MKRLIALAAALLAMAGCETASEEQRRNILAAGSSTVFPFTKAVAQRFRQAHGDFAEPTVQATGTGQGFEQFCGGLGGPHPDLVGASRRMHSAELRRCQQNGVQRVTELQIGLDGLVFVQSPSSPPIQLTRRQIYEALAASPYGQPQTRRTWREIDPALPDAPIEVYGPPENDGTRDSLVEMIMIPGCETNPEMRALRRSDENRFNQVCGGIRSDAAYQAAGEDDERTAMRLIVNPRAIGIFGWSYLERQGERLRGVPIDGTAPSADAIASRRYLAARPLFIYVKGEQAEAVPGLREFLAEYARAVAPGGYLQQAGLIPAPDPVRERMAAAAQALTPIRASALR